METFWVQAAILRAFPGLQAPSRESWASAKSPPTVEEEEVEILTSDQITIVIDKLVGHRLYEIVVVDLATGILRTA